MSSCHSELQKASLNKKVVPKFILENKQHQMHTYGGEERASLNLNIALDADHCSRFRLSLYPQVFKAK